MHIIVAILFLFFGLVVLWKSADVLVSSAVSLAKLFGISPLVIGLTIVAIGTSAPEWAASIAAAIRDAGDVAVGNVYGSNIANLALVGGLCSLIRPIKVQRQALWREIPIMIVVAVLLWPVVSDLYLSRMEGLLLLAVFAGFLVLTIYLARKQAQCNDKHTFNTGQSRNTAKQVILVIIGLAGLAAGAEMTVRGAINIGKVIGLSEAVIGLTIVAIGTSLPELVTSLVAIAKKEDDISIGNIVGSNIFNTLLVTGTAGTIRPFNIASRLAATDYQIMIIVSVAFAVFAFLGRRTINRLSGAALLAGYVMFIVYLFGYRG